MGADIHIFIEHKENDKWIWVNEFEMRIDRNYSLFGVLAGVRGEPYDDRSDPVGVPEDCDPKLMNYLQSGEFHSDTYFTLTDLLNWDVWWDEKFQKVVANFYCSVVGYMLRFDDNPDNVRVIIAFDN
jgi:hypothetical protein